MSGAWWTVFSDRSDLASVLRLGMLFEKSLPSCWRLYTFWLQDTEKPCWNWAGSFLLAGWFSPYWKCFTCSWGREVTNSGSQLETPSITSLTFCAHMCISGCGEVVSCFLIGSAPTPKEVFYAWSVCKVNLLKVRGCGDCISYWGSSYCFVR